MNVNVELVFNAWPHKKDEYGRLSDGKMRAHIWVDGWMGILHDMGVRFRVISESVWNGNETNDG